MGDCCLSGSVHNGTPSGREDKVGGRDVYIAEPSGGSKAKSVIFITDIFGWKFPNVRLLADSYAKAGFYAYVPDFFDGDALPIEALNHIEPAQKVAQNLTTVDKATNTAKTGAVLGPWLAKHREGVSRPLIDAFVNTVKTSAGTGKVGAIGFCWGGRHAILLAHGAAEGSVDAAVAFHPSLLSVPADVEAVSKPLALGFGDRDSHVPLDQAKKIEQLLANTPQVPSEVVIFPDQIHGFALRSDWSNDADKKAMDQAEKQGQDWFNKHLA